MSGADYAAPREPIHPTDARDGIEIPGFSLHRVIGLGATGVVHEGVQHDPPRLVAVKVMRLTVDTEHAQRIRQEALIVSRCSHPSIVKVHASGVIRGGGVEVPWIAMERVDGARAIDAWFREHRPDSGTALLLFERIGDALQHAHLQGLLHRDIKPGNILVDTEGRPVVIDFGLARADGLDSMTEPGTLVGTMRNMAPEVIAGRRADVRSDIFSLAVCMHECMTGQWPFGEPPGHLGAMAAAIESGARAYAQRGSSMVHGDLRWVLARAMDPDPGRRHQSMLSLVEDLRAVRERRPVSARRPSSIYRVRCWMRRNPLAASLAVGLAFVIVLGTAVSARLGIQAARELDRSNRFLEIWTGFMARQPVDRWPEGVSLREPVDALARRHAFEAGIHHPDRGQLIRALALSRAYLELGDTARARELLQDSRRVAAAFDADPSDLFETDLLDLMIRGSVDPEGEDVRSSATALHARLVEVTPWRRSGVESVIMLYADGPATWSCMQASVGRNEPSEALMVAIALPHLARFPEGTPARLRWASESAAALLGRVRGPSTELVRKALRRGVEGLIETGHPDAAEPLRQALVTVDADRG